MGIYTKLIIENIPSDFVDEITRLVMNKCFRDSPSKNQFALFDYKELIAFLE